jgi:predicted ATPase
MYISHLKLKNWRNFKNVDVKIGERVFLVGPNASGKSNLLDVFKFLRDIAKGGGGLQYAIDRRNGVSKIRCLAARQNPLIEIALELTENGKESNKWQYEIGIAQQPRGKHLPILSYERIKGPNFKITRPDDEDKKDELKLTQTYLEQVSRNQEFREIHSFFESVLYLNLIPQLLKYPDLFNISNILEDPFGRNFLERVTKTPERIRNSRLKKIENALKIAVPQLTQLELIKDEMGKPHLQANYEHWRGHGAKQNEEQFSDGTLRLLGFLWSILESNSLILLEEPEMSLNEGVIRQLAPLIHRTIAEKGIQIIISTHSSEFLADPGIGGEETLLLKPSKEGTIVNLANSIPEAKALLDAGLPISEVVMQKTSPEKIDDLRNL